MKFFSFAILIAITLASPLVSRGSNGMSQLQNLKMKNAKFPVFSEHGQLQLMIFGEEAVRNGLLMNITNPVMDIIRKGVEGGAINDADITNSPYPLDADFDKMADFWRQRQYSEGTLFTGNANLNTDTKEAMGEGKVFFRSPLLDLDGLGFRADYGRKIILVQQEIEFVIRTEENNPEIHIQNDTLPEDYQPLRGSGDRLMIDLENNRIVLMDNVELYERSGKLTCEEVTIILGKSEGATPASDSPDAFSGLSTRGISEIICRGNVVVTRAMENADAKLQQARAPEMRYLVHSGEIELISEDNQLPELISGDDRVSARKIVIDRQTEKMTLYDDCRVDFTGDADTAPGVIRAKEMSLDMKSNSGLFTGDVRVDDSRMYLESDKVQMTLDSESDKKAIGDSGLIGFGLPATRSKLKELIFLNNVWMVAKDAEGKRADDRRADADKAVLDYEKNILTLFGNQSSSIGYEGNLVSGKNLEIHLDDEKLVSPAGSTVVLTGGRGGEAAPSAKTVVTSDSSNFDYGGNLMTFSNNVKVRDVRMNLDCDTMEIFLLDVDGVGETRPAADRLDFGVYQNRKTLQKIVCRGNVKVRDKQTILDTDELTFLFSPLAPGEEADPSIFQSNGTRLDRIELGQIQMARSSGTASSDEAEEQLPLGNLFGNSNQSSVMTAQRGWINLREDSAGFHEKVKISNPQGSLECEDLYLYAEPASGNQLSALELANADPYARELDVPSIISLDSHRKLREMVAERDVRFSRTTAQGIVQRSGGDKAVYNVATRMMELTAEPGRQPYIEEGGTGIIESNTGSIFVYPDTDRMSMDGGVRGVIQDHSVFKSR